MHGRLRRGNGCVLLVALVWLGCPGGGDGSSPTSGTGGAMTGTGGRAVGAGGAGGLAIGTGGAGGASLGTGGLATGSGGGLGSGGVEIGSGGMGVGGGGATGTTVGGSTGDCQSDLTGTWDLVATSGSGSTRSGVLVIDANTLSVSVTTSRSWASTPSTKQLSYSAAGGKTLTWSRTDDPGVAIDVQNTPAVLDAGSIPLALGGQWVFAVNHMRCSAAVDATSTILCQTNPAGALVGGTWPETIPAPRTGITYTLNRTSQLASQFGFLGGQWQAHASSGSDSCTAKVEGGTVAIACSTGNSLNGSLHLTVGAGCVASGTATNGWELSARRR